jgi:hypothetical protein
MRKSLKWIHHHTTCIDDSSQGWMDPKVKWSQFSASDRRVPYNEAPGGTHVLTKCWQIDRSSCVHAEADGWSTQTNYYKTISYFLSHRSSVCFLFDCPLTSSEAWEIVTIEMRFIACYWATQEVSHEYFRGSDHRQPRTACVQTKTNFDNVIEMVN